MCCGSYVVRMCFFLLIWWLCVWLVFGFVSVVSWKGCCVNWILLIVYVWCLMCRLSGLCCSS